MRKTKPLFLGFPTHISPPVPLKADEGVGLQENYTKSAALKSLVCE